MKRFLIGLLLWVPMTAVAAPVPYALQKDQSIVGFSWFLGPDKVAGNMPVASADMVIDFDSVQNSRVNVALDVTGAVAGFPFATQGMKSQKVLWADAFPRITFASTEIRRKGTGAEVDGMLTVRGVTKPVTFDARFFRQEGTEPGERRLIEVLVTGELSRAAFGADGWSDLAGDAVSLRILARLERID